MYTIEHAKQWTEEHYDECSKSFQECANVPSCLKVPHSKFEIIWLSGCWLNEKLEENGATEKQISDIGFAHGQRCFGGDPYKWAIKYANEFLETNGVFDKPGGVLAEEVMSEMLR